MAANCPVPFISCSAQPGGITYRPHFKPKKRIRFDANVFATVGTVPIKFNRVNLHITAIRYKTKLFALERCANTTPEEDTWMFCYYEDNWHYTVSSHLGFTGGILAKRDELIMNLFKKFLVDTNEIKEDADMITESL